jgi:hypothetical protein
MANSQSALNLTHQLDRLMILLRKNQAPTGLKDYRPISLMHSFSKLFVKCLARRLAPRLLEIVAPNQSAFIKQWSIHQGCATSLSLATLQEIRRGAAED